MGVGLYGLTYLYPVYLARVRGYSALMIGETMFVTGLCMFFMAPVAGRLVRVLIEGDAGPRFRRLRRRHLDRHRLTKDWDFGELPWPQFLRGVSLMMCMVTINNLALGTLTPSASRTPRGCSTSPATSAARLARR